MTNLPYGTDTIVIPFYIDRPSPRSPVGPTTPRPTPPPDSSEQPGEATKSDWAQPG